MKHGSGSSAPTAIPILPRAFHVRVAALAFVLALGSLATSRRASATPISYQGRLVDGGTLASGAYEITFRLFDDATAGSQIGASLVKDPVTVQNGLFTVELDFGDAAFPGAARWLELAARPSGSANPAETLSPRHTIHAVPYAIRAFSGSGNASELLSGTVPDARLAPTIARTSDLLSTSNSLASLWSDLSVRLTTLTESLTAISNAAQSTIPAGINVVSADPADAGLLGQGFVRFLTIPATGWVPGAAGGLSARSAHSSVWTGQALILWGGTTGGGNPSALGSRYEPASDQWFPLSEINPPAARHGHSAVWTPQGMLLWGGFGGGFLASGARYSLDTANWSPLPSLNAPSARDEHVAVWTGSRMIVWAGRNAGGLLADGALYDPVAQQWTSLAPTAVTEARQDAVGVWTGSQFVVWGGLGTSGELGTGARLPLTGGAVPGAWSAIATTGAPSARVGHTAVWTGQRVIVWGGHSGSLFHGTGAAYDPDQNSWQSLPSVNAPSARTGHVAVWTGEEMLIFGGRDAGGDLATGAAYNPAKGTWRSLPGTGGPVARHDATAAWSGTELLVFGGLQGNTPVASLQRLNPQPTWHFYRKP
ncbi:MAG: Kelch repeat-containing protein [Limisphaerales bacterium]